MKAKSTFLFLAFIIVLGSELNAQFMNQNRFGRQRSAIPQGPTAAAQEPEKLTAEQYVDQEMPKFIETMSLDPFEEAVVRSILVKSVQKRMELQILKLNAQKMQEEFQKTIKAQDAELKASLPPEKFQIYMEMRENPTKAKRKQKKKKKKSIS
ncbi:MAG: hypothetical protein ACFB0A_10280 [Croceivirga sp.]